MNHHAAPTIPVLDIGGEVGAIVVHLTAIPDGGELHAHPADEPDQLFHTGVHPHPPQPRAAVAIFPEVHTGRYHLLLEPVGLADQAIDVTGGAVTELDLTTGDDR